MYKFIIQDENTISFGTCIDKINMPDDKNIILIKAEICMLCDKLRRHILTQKDYIVPSNIITFLK